MKLRRLFCCFLLCVFTFSVVFSVSAFATDINGYSVKSYYALGNPDFGPLQYTDFTTTIVSSSTAESISIQTDILFSETIKENAIFDLIVNLDHSYSSSVSATYYLKDSNGLILSYGDCSVSNELLVLKDLVVDGGDLSSIEILFNVLNPSWTEQIIEETPTTITFRFDDRSYTCENGMTWAEFCDSDYNPYSNFYYTDYGVYYVSSSKRVQVKSTGDYVSSSDLISAIDYDYGISTASALYDVSMTSTVNYTYNFSITNIDVDIIQSGEEYSGIIGWIKNVFNSITGLPARISNSISGFFTNLGSKITDLGDFLLDGIKGLFLPSEQSIIGLKADFEEILEDRFGAVYESSKIVNDFANSLNSSASTALIPSGDGGVTNMGSVSFPDVTVNLAGTPFTFGGWNVQLKYSGFEALYEALRLITNICATFMVINALKSRMEGIVR